MSEEIHSEATEVLSDKLSFKVPQSASYVLNRRSVQYYPQGSNIYTTGAGTKLVRFTLAGDDWIDLDTIRFNFRLTNTDATDGNLLRPLGGPHLFWRRGRLLCGGAVLEDILNYNRTHEMFDSMMADSVRINNDIEGFGNRWDDVEYGTYNATTLTGIPSANNANNYKYVSFKPLFGLLNAEKMLPLTYAPLVFEFELCSNATDPIVSPDSTTFKGGSVEGHNTSTSWQIDQPFITSDVIQLDPGLDNQYISHLNAGGELKLTYDTVIVQQQSIQKQQNVNINVARAVSRLKAVFLTFFKQDNGSGLADGVAKTRVQSKSVVNKEAIEFSHPMVYGNGTAATKNYDYDYEVSWWLQLGSKRYPERECDTSAQTMYQLRKCLNLPIYHQHSVSFDFKKYITDKFIVGMSLEKIPEFAFTGESTKSGQLLFINVKPSNPSSMSIPYAAGAAKELGVDWLYITLQAEMNLEIRAAGITVFD